MSHTRTPQQLTSIAAPRYRADAKGSLSKIKAECVALFVAEIEHAEHFIVFAEDAVSTMREYSDYLTPAELAACFKRATRDKGAL